ncbi:kinase subunit of RNA polymerase II carboxy-terminal domain kinase I [Mortierella alpina]|nr:kinase subunit of RNA polymerase II carboxy-terminal domain kinase I [Mortierella alpina]
MRHHLLADRQRTMTIMDLKELMATIIAIQGHRATIVIAKVGMDQMRITVTTAGVLISPSLEHLPPPPAGYVMTYPATDPAQQPLSSPTVAPMLKGEDLYERVGQVGEGTYGKVYKARNKQTGEYVALKRIRMETEKDGFPITAMREIKLLQSLSHRHVVSLKELMVSKGAVYMVFEYMDHDLTGILAHPNLKFRPEHVKCLMKQLLEGLGFLHHKGVLHRDIKGSNLLVNKLGELKLADFGLARLFQKKTKRDYTNRVITLWYRPPELILGATAYGPEVDMWSAGCIMVELFTRRPIFQGHNEIMQLDFIWKTMGTPQKETWPDVDQLPWYELIKHVNSENRSSRFREMFSKYMSPAALDLAEALLSLNPKKRPTAAESLANFAYFTEEEPAACLPEDLPKIEGDWHEYESKQRKKANARPKDQQHPTQPAQPSSRQPSDEIHSDRTEQDKPGRAPRPPVSKKHTLSGASKSTVGTTSSAPVGLVVLSGSSALEPTAAVVEQVPDELMSAPKMIEHEAIMGIMATTTINAADTMTMQEIAIETGTGTGTDTVSVSVNAIMVEGEATIAETGLEIAKGTEAATAAANGIGTMIVTESGLGVTMSAIESAFETGAMMMRTSTIETVLENATGMANEDAIESASATQSTAQVEGMTKIMTERGAMKWIGRCRSAG